MTPFARNRGMEVSKGFDPEASPQRRGPRRPTGGALTANMTNLSNSEKEQDDNGTQTLIPDVSAFGHETKKVGNLMPPFQNVNESPSPVASSSSRRRSPRNAQDITASTSSVESARKLSALRGATGKKKRSGTEGPGSDVDVSEPQDGSPVRKKHKR